nr:(E)-4-hydroxy-3-methylbut-2-enyl-diphosphate synthase [Bacteroides sp.]
MGRYDYRRRPTVAVRVGNVEIGADNPVKLQSMTNTSTMDTEGSIAQCERIAAAGAHIVRLTAQGVRESENLASIRAGLRDRGVDIPLVADIHFNPKAAFDAATRVEKVRINPGNFVDPGRVFKKIDYTDAEYAAELEKIERVFGEFLDLCVANDTAVRLGVNHGSLSDRIMSRYGDTPAGMVESAMEFLRVARRRGFSRIVISIKASNVVVMVQTVRLLVKAMDAEDMHFPLHLGVTEAGDGEDGRVKSAVGIGTLLSEGLGDTIRVSLSEAPEAEVPVARIIADYIASLASAPSIDSDAPLAPDPHGTVPMVASAVRSDDFDPDRSPDIFADDSRIVRHDLADSPEKLTVTPSSIILLTGSHPNFSAAAMARISELRAAAITNRVIVSCRLEGESRERATVLPSVMLGTLLMNGFTGGVMIESTALTPRECVSLAFGILQAARLRITRTEYIACPGCGRTLFDLQDTLRRVKEATASLKGLKIGVMGCIVNGPGEMADADYGYVGAGVGRVSLYKGKECVMRNIPQDEAIPRLVEFLKSEGYDL